MTWSTTEILRIQAIESKLNEMQTAVSNLATKHQLKSILTLLQSNLTSISDDLEQLEITGAGPALEAHKTEDHHTQYLTTARGDVRYFQETEFIDSTTGTGDAGKPIKLDASGVLDPSLVSLSFESHNTLSGLDADDHTQYHTDDRANTWFVSKDLADLGTKSHNDLSNIGTNSHSAIDTHLLVASGARHFLEEEIDHGSISGLSDDDHSIYHTDARGDARYYTETELDAGQLDNRYYTETETDTLLSGVNHGDLENIGTDDHHTQSHTIASHSDTTSTGAELETLTDGSDAGSLHTHDVRYYTEAEVNAIASGINHGDLESLTSDDHTQYLLTDGSRQLTGSLQLETDIVLSNTVAGNLLITDSIGTTYPRIQFGGTTNEFPAIARVGRDIHLRTGDDGDYTSFACKSLDAYGPTNIYEDVYISGITGIGTNSPDGTLHIHSNTAGSITPSTAGDDLVIENSSHAGISILSPSANSGSIYFGDPGSATVGKIQYDHANDWLKFGTAGTNQLYINSAGLLQFAGTTSSYPAWKRSGTQLQARLADDSDYANIRAKELELETDIVFTNNVAGTLLLTESVGTTYPRIQFGGTTNSYPMLFRNGDDIQISKADGSSRSGLICEKVSINNSNYFAWIGRSNMSSTADGKIRLLNSDYDGFTSLALGLETSSFPMLKVDGADLKFRLGDNSADTNIFAADGLFSGNVGIGTDSPEGPLHVYAASAGSVTAHTSADDLIVESDGSAGISILTPNDAWASIFFGDIDTNGNYVGGFQYNHVDDKFYILVDNAYAMTIDSSGNVGINETSPLGSLHVKTADVGAISPHAGYDEIVLENTDNCGITIYSGTSHTGAIIFADADSDVQGYISYNHSTVDQLTFATAGSPRMYLSSNGYLQFGGTTSSYPALKHVGATLLARLADDSDYTHFKADNITSYGAFYVGGSVLANAYLELNDNARLAASSEGCLALYNSTSTDFTMLQFGGTSASEPALKRNTAQIQARLADDSDYTDFVARNYVSTSEYRFSGSSKLDAPVNGELSAKTNSDGVGTFIMGSFTTTARDALSPSTGAVIFNTTTTKFQGWTGATWVDLH